MAGKYYTINTTMKTYPMTVVKSVWRRIKKPSKQTIARIRMANNLRTMLYHSWLRNAIDTGAIKDHPNWHKVKWIELPRSRQFTI